jgi:hypothetical protein
MEPAPPPGAGTFMAARVSGAASVENEERMDRLAARLRAKSHGGRSDAYRWLRERHDALKAMFAESRSSWSTIAAELEAEGLRGAKGQVMTAKGLRKMWLRVVRDVEAAAIEKHDGVTPRKKQPRDLPATWQPTPIDPASPSPPRESSFAIARRDMAERSGRRITPDGRTISVYDRDMPATKALPNPDKP